MNKYIKCLGIFMAVTMSITSLSSASDNEKVDSVTVGTVTATDTATVTQRNKDNNEQYRFTVDGIEYTKDSIKEIVKNVDDTLDIITNSNRFDSLYVNGTKVSVDGPCKEMYWTPTATGDYKIKIAIEDYSLYNDLYTVAEFNLKVVDKNEGAPAIGNITQSKSVKDSKNNVSFNVISNNKDTSYKYYVRKINNIMPTLCGSYEKFNPYTFLGESKDGYFETNLNDNDLETTGEYTQRFEVKVVAENDKGYNVCTKEVDKIDNMNVTVNDSDYSNYVYDYNNRIFKSKDENIRIIIGGNYSKYKLYVSGKLLDESTDKNYFDINKEKYPDIYHGEFPATVIGIDKDGKETKETLVFDLNCNEDDLPQKPDARSDFFNPEGSSNNAMVCVHNYEEGTLYKFELIREYVNIDNSNIILPPETVLVKDYSKENYFEMDTNKIKTDYALSKTDSEYIDGQGHEIKYYVKVTAKNDYGVSKEDRATVLELDPTKCVDPGPVKGLWSVIVNGVYKYIGRNEDNKVSYNAIINKENTILPIEFNHSAKYYSVNGQDIKEIKDNKINVSFDKAGENSVKIYEDDKGEALLDVSFNVIDDIKETSQAPKASSTPETKTGDNNIALILIGALLLSGAYVKKSARFSKRQ